MVEAMQLDSWLQDGSSCVCPSLQVPLGGFGDGICPDLLMAAVLGVLWRAALWVQHGKATPHASFHSSCTNSQCSVLELSC